MDVKVVDAGPCRKVIQVQAPPESVAPDYDEAVKAYAAVARLPGFRPGKAPLRMVERHYARQIESDTKDRLVPQLYRKALAQEKLNAVAVVEVKDVVFGKATGLGFQVTVDVAPDFKLPTYKGIPVEAKPVLITDAQVDDAIQRMRERLARFEPISGRTAQTGDLLRVDFDASIEGRPLAEVLPKDRALGEGRDFLILLGEPEFLPGFNEGLAGAAVDEAREIAVTFPAQYRIKSLEGLRVVYAVKVKALQQRILPAIDAEFLKQMGAETEPALRERFQKELGDGAQRMETARQKDAIARYLLEQTEFEVPQSLVEHETRIAVRSMVQDISRRGATRDQIVEQQENIVSQATRGSTERVRLTYILGRIAEAEHITVEDAEVEQQVQSLAARYEMPPARMQEELDKRGAMDGMRGDIRSEKTLDFLLKEAKS